MYNQILGNLKRCGVKFGLTHRQTNPAILENLLTKFWTHVLKKVDPGVEFDVIRQNYGTGKFTYGSEIVFGTHRVGITFAFQEFPR